MVFSRHTAVKEKTADIGMVSRELTLKKAESTHDAIALYDGIAVVVNNDTRQAKSYGWTWRF